MQHFSSLDRVFTGMLVGVTVGGSGLCCVPGLSSAIFSPLCVGSLFSWFLSFRSLVFPSLFTSQSVDDMMVMKIGVLI